MQNKNKIQLTFAGDEAADFFSESSTGCSGSATGVSGSVAGWAGSVDMVDRKGEALCSCEV